MPYEGLDRLDQFTRHDPPPSLSDAASGALADALARSIQGEVRFDRGSRTLYATDGSNYRQVPIGVVVPKSESDVITTMELCRNFGAPVLARGGGTSLAGQCCNVAVVVDFSKYLHNIVSLDPQTRRARVQPGVILDQLRDAAEKHHLTFGPDPATHSHNCLGGMLGNNSCGPHSVKSGRTADNVHSLEVLTYDGTRLTVGPTGDEELESIIAEGGRRGDIYAGLKRLRDQYGTLIRERYPDIPRRVSGYNLDELLPERGMNVARALVGSEGTCVTILEAELRLVDSPRSRVLLVLGYPDICTAGDVIPVVMATDPWACEAVDDLLIRFLQSKDQDGRKAHGLPDGGSWLLVEYGGDTPEAAEAAARAAMRAIEKNARPVGSKLLTDRAAQKAMWEIRESGLAATAWVPGMPPTWPGWEDSAVPPAQVGAYLRDFKRKLAEYGYGCALYGHFGQGCIHVRIDFDLGSKDGVAKYRRFVSEMADIVLSYGGSLSGEHGDGQARGELLPKMYGPELIGAMHDFKRLWDPSNKMNPGKVIDPYPLDTNLRVGPDFKPKVEKHGFALKDDHGSFAKAAMRCVGVGKCRRLDGGVMCPSFMATREEKHSTRGRARMLFEMVHGGPLADGWNSREVHDALDLCLACKGCKKDCPVNVDMATYKAEFHSHYYANRLRPRAAYSLGLIHWWSRAAAQAPGIVNVVTQTPGLARLAKWAAGIHPERDLPRFAPMTWQEHLARRGVRNCGKPRVALLPDTFNNYFHPLTGMHAVELLEAAGFCVEMPTSAKICCGRPLYAWGMLDLARRNLERVMEVFGPYAEQGIPIVGIEPACLTTLVDELPELFPHNPRAAAIAGQARFIADILAERQEFQPRRLGGSALLHPHCYEHAVLGIDKQRALLERAGLEVELSEAGCCGMAGSFGFEAEHYHVSQKCAERKLLPMVRRSAPDRLVVADGYACREQIGQGTDRETEHLVDVLWRAVQP